VPSGTLKIADKLDRGELDIAIAAREWEGEPFLSKGLKMTRTTRTQIDFAKV